MNTKASFSFLIFSISILSLQLLFITSKADEALIERLCNSSPYPDACLSCIRSDPGSSTADEIRLIETAMSCAALDVSILYKDTISYQQNSTDPAMKDALETCLGRITDGQSKIIGAANLARSRQFKDAQGVIKFQVLAPILSCSSYVRSKGLQVPDVISLGLAAVNRDFGVVISILGNV